MSRILLDGHKDELFRGLDLVIARTWIGSARKASGIINCSRVRYGRVPLRSSLTCDCAVAAAQFRLYPSRIEEHLSVISSLIWSIRREDKFAIAVWDHISDLLLSRLGQQLTFSSKMTHHGVHVGKTEYVTSQRDHLQRKVAGPHSSLAIDRSIKYRALQMCVLTFI